MQANCQCESLYIIGFNPSILTDDAWCDKRNVNTSEQPQRSLQTLLGDFMPPRSELLLHIVDTGDIAEIRQLPAFRKSQYILDVVDQALLIWSETQHISELFANCETRNPSDLTISSIHPPSIHFKATNPLPYIFPKDIILKVRVEVNITANNPIKPSTLFAMDVTSRKYSCNNHVKNLQLYNTFIQSITTCTSLIYSIKQNP